MTPPGLVPRTSETLVNDHSTTTTTTTGLEGAAAAASSAASPPPPPPYEHQPTADTFARAPPEETEGELLVTEAVREAEDVEEVGVPYDGEVEGGAELYTLAEDGNRLGGGSASGSGSGGQLFSPSDLVYDHSDGVECRICLSDERKGA